MKSGLKLFKRELSLSKNILEKIITRTEKFTDYKFTKICEQEYGFRFKFFDENVKSHPYLLYGDIIFKEFEQKLIINTRISLIIILIAPFNILLFFLEPFNNKHFFLFFFIIELVFYIINNVISWYKFQKLADYIERRIIDFSEN